MTAAQPAALPDPTQWAIPAFVALILLEMWLTKRRGVGRYDWRDTGTSLSLGLGSILFGAMTAGAVLALSMWVFGFALFPVPWTWWAFVLCFVLDDLA